MDAVDSVVDPLREFAKDSVRLVKRCHKPDSKGIASIHTYIYTCMHIRICDFFGSVWWIGL
jgi:preprotein translocase subunit Sss1